MPDPEQENKPFSSENIQNLPKKARRPMINRQQYQSHLSSIYAMVKNLTTPVLNHPDLHRLCIRLRPLKVSDNGDYSERPEPCFFEPLCLSQLQRHPVDFDYTEEEDVRAKMEQLNRRIAEYSSNQSSPPSNYPDTLCHRMNWEFHLCPRKNLLEEGDSMCELTPWLPTGCNERIFHASLGLDVFRNKHPRWKPDFGAQTINWPHAFFLLQHQIEVDDRLLRGEVLAILAAIRTRLDLPEFSEHIIVPILVFSFMGNQHGRILQGFYSCGLLNIWMTELFDFRTIETAEQNVRMFLQHMTCQPVGNTKEQPTMRMVEINDMK